MNFKRIVFVMLFAFLLLLSVGFVFGVWVDDGESGVWDISENDFWVSPDNSTWHTASLDFNYSNILNFVEWKATVFQICEGWGSSWWDDDFEVESIFRIVDNSSSHEVRMSFWARGEIFSWIVSDYCAFVLYVDDEVVISHWGEYEHDKFYFDLYQSESNSSELVCKIRVYDGEDDLLYGYDDVVGVGSSWFDNVTLYQSHDCWGKGWCWGNKTGEVIIWDDSPEGTDVGIPTVQESWWELFVNDVGSMVELLPQWLQDYIFQFGVWSASLMSFLVPLSEMIFSLLPLVPFFLAFYIIDALALSIKRESFTPLGLCFLTLFNAMRGIVGVLVSIAHALYSFIHFW